MKNNNNYNNECTLVPVTDVYETENDYVLKMEMPGIVKENLDITLDNDELEIIGKVSSGEDDGDLRLSEYTLHDYYRKFKIGDTVNREKINANLENGILTLTMNKNEEVKPKKIEVKVH